MLTLTRLICSFIMLSVLVSTVDAGSSRYRPSSLNISAPMPKSPAPPVDAALKPLENLYKDHKNKIDVNMSNAFLKTAVIEFSEKRVDLILNPPKTYTVISKPRENVKPSMQGIQEAIISATEKCPGTIILKLMDYFEKESNQYFGYDTATLDAVLKHSAIRGNGALFNRVMERTKVVDPKKRRQTVSQKGIDEAFFAACQEGFAAYGDHKDYETYKSGFAPFIDTFLTGALSFQASDDAVYQAIRTELGKPRSSVLEKLLLPRHFEKTYLKLSRSVGEIELFKKFFAFMQSKQMSLSDNAKKYAFKYALKNDPLVMELIFSNPILLPSQEMLDEIFAETAVLPSEKA